MALFPGGRPSVSGEWNMFPVWILLFCVLGETRGNLCYFFHIKLLSLWYEEDNDSNKMSGLKEANKCNKPCGEPGTSAPRKRFCQRLRVDWGMNKNREKPWMTVRTSLTGKESKARGTKGWVETDVFSCGGHGMSFVFVILGIGIQTLAHTRQMLYHWATPMAIFLSSFFLSGPTVSWDSIKGDGSRSQRSIRTRTRQV